MFTDELKITVRLHNEKKTHLATGERVKSCALELNPSGFSGRVTLWSDVLQTDALAPWFLDPELMQIELDVEPMHATSSDTKAARITIAGLVTERGLRETFVGADGKDVIEREYSIAFADPATVLWRQHWPLELVADGKPKALIEGHLAGHIKLDCTLADADKARPILCVPCGDSEASFYDFVTWYAERFGGTWQYDYFAARYRLAKQRAVHTAKLELDPLAVDEVRVRVPAPLRHGARVLNANCDAAQTAPVEQQHGVDGIARDRLIASPTHADLDAAKTIESHRLAQPQPEIDVALLSWPLVPLMPGAKAKLAKDFSDDIHPAKKQLHVLGLALDIEAADPTRQRRDDTSSRTYQGTLRLTLEHADDERLRVPEHREPRWPILVEGTIVSEIGAADDRTYMPSDDKEHYVVHVPLWNQKIKIPFGPQFVPGHFFAPAFKGSRVVVALYFDRAEIARFLDWGTDVRLPHESQGNHLLFGKNAQSQTSLKHSYVDDKPVLSLARMQKADRGLLQLEEGMMVLEVKEDESALASTATHDLTPQAAQAQAALEGGAQQGIGKIKSAGVKSMGALDGKLSSARATLAGALDSLDADVSGRVDAGKAELQGKVDGIDGRVAELRARIEAGKGELQAKRGGA